MKAHLHYEEAAERRTVEGWVCKTCSNFWGVDEHAARYCCALSVPCKCGGRVAPRRFCETCLAKSNDEAWEEAERVEWDEASPLVTFRSDKYFFDEDSVQDFIDEHEIDLANLRLEVCEPTRSPVFDLLEFLYDVLPEDVDVLDAQGEQVEAGVNAWIKLRSPFSYRGSGKVLSLDSVRTHFAPWDRDEGGAS